MIRLARANRVKVHSFYAQYFGRDIQIWNRDIDHFAPIELIELLSQKTGVSVQRIQQATLRSYEGFAFMRLNEVGTTRWLLPLGIYHRTRRSYGQQFCPICIAEGPEPYLRKHWRLAFFFQCTAHCVMLVDRCRNCGKPLSPHRTDILAGRGSMTRATIRHCAYCLSDLAGGGVLATEVGTRVQLLLDDALRQGYFLIAGQPVYTHLFLDGLRALMQGLNRSQISDEQTPRVFEYGSPAYRCERLCEAFDLLNAWPEKFISRCVATRRTYTDFVFSSQPTPWWLYSVLKMELFRSSAKLSIQEAKAIFDVTEKQTGIASAAAARRFSGRDISALVERVGVTESEVDILFAELDHRIAEVGGANRWLLLRDKVMLLAGRRWVLPLETLAQMTVTKYSNRVYSSEPFWNNVSNPDELDAVIAWYVAKVRPLLAPRATTDSLFVSARGEPIGPTAIQARLAKAVKGASLRLGVSDWKSWIRPTLLTDSQHK